MTRKITIYIIVIVALAAIGSGWYYWQRAQAPRLIPKSEPIAVKVSKVIRQSVPDVVDAIGVLQAKQQINVTPEISGIVISINYTPGSFVKKGTVLFRLDDRIYLAKLKSSKATLRLAKLNYQRYTKLAKLGALSKQALDTIRANYLQAQADVKTNQTYLSQTIIKAPFDAYVGPKNISIGDYVQQGQLLTSLTDRKNLYVDYQVSEKYLPKLKLGQDVKIIVTNMPGRLFKGKVSYIAPTINVSTHSVALQAAVLNLDNQLTPGSYVKIKQHIGLQRDALVIPQQSLIPTITGNKVFIVVNGKAQSVNVKIGATINNQVEIIKGLSFGDVVVTAGQQQLKNGTKVKVVGGQRLH